MTSDDITLDHTTSLSILPPHRAAEVLPLMRDSLDELLLCLDLRLLDNEGVWSVLRGLTAALYRWSLSVSAPQSQ